MFGLSGQQPTKYQRAVSWPRSVAACVLALFVILQGLSATCSALARAINGTGELRAQVSLVGVTCAIDVMGRAHSPAHESGDVQCCVLCGGRDLDGGTYAAATHVCYFAASYPATVWIEQLFADFPAEPPTGWASSWSSQSPPSFS